eukprot:2593583-Lingulodinium_polyedra.AAC.1
MSVASAKCRPTAATAPRRTGVARGVPATSTAGSTRQGRQDFGLVPPEGGPQQGLPGRAQEEGRRR